jgi:stage V sporulation protein D (sporulation-specific penicillin-binding protein)
MAVRGMVPNETVKTRVRTVFGVVVLCYAVLVGRLLYLQGFEGERIREQAENDRLKEITLPVHRGAIRDRNGNVMAVSRYRATLCFNPYDLIPAPQTKAKDVEKNGWRLDASVRKVARVLKISEADLRAQLAEAKAGAESKKPSKFEVVQKNLSLEQVQALRMYANEDAELSLKLNPKKKPNQNRPKEAALYLFQIQDGDQRVYTMGDRATQIVGYVKPKVDGRDKEDRGVAGLEYALDGVLRGKKGSVKMEVDRVGREIPDTRREMKPAQEGLDVVTTLDNSIQHIVTEEIGKIAAQYHPKGIAAVVIAPETGDILALVSYPTFDPNPGKPRKIDAGGEALRERTVASIYEPGSTLKTMTVAAALEDKIIGLDSTFYCGGRIKIGKRSIKCDLHAGESAGHGSVSPLDLIRRSCNIGSAQIGMKMKYNRLHGWMEKFGLLTDPKLNLPAETGGFWSMDRNEDPTSNAKLARVAFGHSITTTPLNVAMAYAAIANGGTLMQPRLIAAYRDSQGNIVKEFAPKIVRKNLLSPQTCREMRAMLRAVVGNGTGKAAAIQGYQLAGKTGTAKKYRASLYVGSFAGFIPAGADSKARAVILVAVDEPHGAIYGGAVAAPAFREISRRLLSYWNVPEDDPASAQYAQAHSKLKRTAGH